jgi:hypothetical protein
MDYLNVRLVVTAGLLIGFAVLTTAGASPAILGAFLALALVAIFVVAFRS